MWCCTCRIKPGVKSEHSLVVCYLTKDRAEAPINLRYANENPDHSSKASGSVSCPAGEEGGKRRTVCCSASEVHCRSQMTQHCILRMWMTKLANKKSLPQQQQRCQPHRMMAGASKQVGTSKMCRSTVLSPQAGSQAPLTQAVQTDALLMLQGKGRLHQGRAKAMTCS